MKQWENRLPLHLSGDVLVQEPLTESWKADFSLYSSAELGSFRSVCICLYLLHGANEVKIVCAFLKARSATHGVFAAWNV